MSVNSLYTVVGPLKVYGEAAASTEERDGSLDRRSVPVSTLAGPVLETKLLTFRANYTFQSASYFPLLGYYLGDRAGPFGEIKVRPTERIELYASGSAYQNNLAKDLTLPTFKNTSESVGLSAQLPANFSLNTQLVRLNLSSRIAGQPQVQSRNEQKTLTVTRRFVRHNLRLTARDYQDVSTLNAQRQRSGEIEETFRIRRLTVGGAVRAQRVRGVESRTSLFYRGLAQFQAGRFTAYANLETGNDLQNKTLFATNTISTTVLGASLTLGRNWDFQGEAYRNKLVTELNPQSIFALQGQGVFVPGALAALNQWSIYFRMSRRFTWGKGGSVGDLNQYAMDRAPLRGYVEGFVVERLPEGAKPVEGVPVNLGGRTTTTDQSGRFSFLEVPEGAQKVELELRELPAEFDPGKTTELTVFVNPGKASRVDLDVVRLGSVGGKLSGPEDTPLNNVILRMLPGERYTTPDANGKFNFYNVRPGEYQIVVDETTLPEFGVVNTSRISVVVEAGKQTVDAAFMLEIRKPQKPVRTVEIQ